MAFLSRIKTVNGDLRVYIGGHMPTGILVHLSGQGPVGKTTVREAMEEALRKRGGSIAFSDQERGEDGEWLPADKILAKDVDVETAVSAFFAVGMGALRAARLIGDIEREA
jgi:ABC-type branched-subunit amino acid transport system ATPase component